MLFSAGRLQLKVVGDHAERTCAGAASGTAVGLDFGPELQSHRHNNA